MEATESFCGSRTRRGWVRGEGKPKRSERSEEGNKGERLFEGDHYRQVTRFELLVSEMAQRADTVS